MKTTAKLVFSAALLAAAVLSDGILLVPAFAAFVVVWGVKI